MVQFPPPPLSSPQSQRNKPRGMLPVLSFLPLSYFLEILPVSGFFTPHYHSQISCRSWTTSGLSGASGLTFPRNLVPRSSPPLLALFCKQNYLRSNLASLVSEWHPGHTPFSASPSPDPFMKGKLHPLGRQKEVAKPWRKRICSQEGWKDF